MWRKKFIIYEKKVPKTFATSTILATFAPQLRGKALKVLPHSPTLATDRVAQLVEHLTFNQRVSGSNPDAITK